MNCLLQCHCHCLTGGLRWHRLLPDVWVPSAQRDVKLRAILVDWMAKAVVTGRLPNLQVLTAQIREVFGSQKMDENADGSDVSDEDDMCWPEETDSDDEDSDGEDDPDTEEESGLEEEDNEGAGLDEEEDGSNGDGDSEEVLEGDSDQETNYSGESGSEEGVEESGELDLDGASYAEEISSGEADHSDSDEEGSSNEEVPVIA